MATFVDGEQIRTEMRGGRCGDDLIRSLNQFSDGETSYHGFVQSLDGQRKQAYSEGIEEDTSTMCSRRGLPTAIDINNFWEFGKPKSEHVDILIKANQLKVVRDDTTLLFNLDWTVERGQRWHLAGTNGGECRPKINVYQDLYQS